MVRTYDSFFFLEYFERATTDVVNKIVKLVNYKRHQKGNRNLTLKKLSIAFGISLARLINAFI